MELDADELIRLPPASLKPEYGDTHTLFDAIKKEFFQESDWNPNPISRIDVPHGGLVPLVLRGIINGLRKPVRGKWNGRKRYHFMEVSIKKQLRHTRTMTLFGMTLGLFRGLVPAVRGKHDYYNDVIASGLAAGFFAVKPGPRMVLFASTFVTCFAMVATTMKIHASVKQNYPSYFYDPDLGFPKEFRRKDGTLFWQDPRPAGWTPDQEPPKPEKIPHPMPFLQVYDYDEDLETPAELIAAERVMSKMNVSISDFSRMDTERMLEVGEALLKDASFADLDSLDGGMSELDADLNDNDFESLDTMDFRRPQYPAPVYDDANRLDGPDGLDI